MDKSAPKGEVMAEADAKGEKKAFLALGRDALSGAVAPPDVNNGISEVAGRPSSDPSARS
jgi:hypothetical protein